ncbi:hypothetical protein MHZ36_14195 [Staphylococcus sp. ACRSN]|uniref:hypothetical protein n=1 Tax=Staphylococcus sp. ACRSN TaxID=2918214 RepID=UPI001EF21C74|nr:hypothetical protein [Staphylococcus sp. ACRSN]MCG7340409.1 hypothetical protein [Staphylococcus sp. ACRSN]
MNNKKKANIKNQLQHENFESKQRSITKYIIIIFSFLIFFLIVIAILFGAYKFIANSFADSGNVKQQHNSNTSKKDVPKINVLTQDFHQTYMNKNRVHSYKNIAVGDSKNKIENKYGKGKKVSDIDNEEVTKYGDIGITYKEGKVKRFFVIPKDTTIQSFTSYYGQATSKDDSGNYIYDDDKNNKFMIKIFTGQNGEIEGIENVEAKNNEVDFSDGIKNKAEAEAVAKRVLGFRNIKIKIGAISDTDTSYKVKYGKEDEKNQNRELNIRKTDGLTTGDTTASD